jgi:hypothetical protein
VKIRSAGVDLTHFSNPIDLTSTEAIESALDTVQLHHEGDVIWVEGTQKT